MLILRILYSLTAISTSVAGLVSFVLWYNHNGVTTPSIKAWYWYRCILAIFQLPLHLGLLLPARFIRYYATLVTFAFLDNNPDKYYNLLTVCNYGLGTSIILGIVACYDIYVLYPQRSILLILEASSISIWTCVLLSRLVGIYTKRTKEMFYLAWDPDMQYF